MVWAVRFLHAGEIRQARFEHRGVRLPVSARRGAQCYLLPWGRRPREPGQLPVGGWARLTQIQAGLWDAYMPRAVQLPASGFATRDVAGRLQWFEVTRGQCVQGCLACVGKERRVYIVTLDTAPGEIEFEHWPRIVTAPIQTAQISGIPL